MQKGNVPQFKRILRPHPVRRPLVCASHGFSDEILNKYRVVEPLSRGVPFLVFLKLGAIRFSFVRNWIWRRIVPVQETHPVQVNFHFTFPSFGRQSVLGQSPMLIQPSRESRTGAAGVTGSRKTAFDAAAERSPLTLAGGAHGGSPDFVRSVQSYHRIAREQLNTWASAASPEAWPTFIRDLLNNRFSTISRHLVGVLEKWLERAAQIQSGDVDSLLGSWQMHFPKAFRKPPSVENQQTEKFLPRAQLSSIILRNVFPRSAWSKWTRRRLSRLLLEDNLRKKDPGGRLPLHEEGSGDFLVVSRPAVSAPAEVDPRLVLPARLQRRFQNGGLRSASLAHLGYFPIGIAASPLFQLGRWPQIERSNLQPASAKWHTLAAAHQMPLLHAGGSLRQGLPMGKVEGSAEAPSLALPFSHLYGPPLDLKLANPRSAIPQEVTKALKESIKPRANLETGQMTRPPTPIVDIHQLTSQVCDEIERKVRIERERRGL